MVQLFAVLASAGRPQIVAELVTCSQRLELPGDATVHWLLATPSVEDAPAELPTNWSRHTGVRGLTSQRNLALSQVPADADYVFFFDDDALPREDYLVAAVAHFEAHPDHIALTGRLLRDGAAEKREVSPSEADQALAESWRQTGPSMAGWEPTSALYGCNFAVRWAAVSNLRFEERFPLYSWLEDLDYSAQVRRRGPMAQVRSAVAVHRGVTSGGRTQHRRYGYSQVANPALMLAKGTLHWAEVPGMVVRPLLRNLLGTLLPRESQWRRQRVSGNALALADLLRTRGRAQPERILDL